MAELKSEGDARVAAHDAREKLVYAALLDDLDLAAQARRELADAEAKVAKAVHARLGDRIASQLSELEAASPDPVLAALNGGLTYDEALDAVRRQPARYLAADEAAEVARDPHALRLVLLARRRDRPFAEVLNGYRKRQTESGSRWPHGRLTMSRPSGSGRCYGPREYWWGPGDRSGPVRDAAGAAPRGPGRW